MLPILALRCRTPLHRGHLGMGKSLSFVRPHVHAMRSRVPHCYAVGKKSRLYRPSCWVALRQFAVLGVHSSPPSPSAVMLAPNFEHRACMISALTSARASPASVSPAHSLCTRKACHTALVFRFGLRATSAVPGVPAYGSLRTCPSCSLALACSFRGSALPVRPAARPSPSVWPNMSVNRRRHGRPAGPCSRLGSSSAARPGRPAASPRLPLR